MFIEIVSFFHIMNWNENKSTSAKNPSNFDADPEPDPGSAPEKNVSRSRSFLKDLLIFF